MRLQGKETKGTVMKIEYAMGKASKNDKFSPRGKLEIRKRKLINSLTRMLPMQLKDTPETRLP